MRYYALDCLQYFKKSLEVLEYSQALELLSMQVRKQAIIPGVRAHKHASTQGVNHGKNAGMQASQVYDLEDLLICYFTTYKVIKKGENI